MRVLDRELPGYARVGAVPSHCPDTCAAKRDTPCTRSRRSAIGSASPCSGSRWLSLVSGCGSMAPPSAGGVQRLYVLYCGEAQIPDVSPWSPGFNVGQSGGLQRQPAI